jgi:hypothetical protein
MIRWGAKGVKAFFYHASFIEVQLRTLFANAGTGQGPFFVFRNYGTEHWGCHNTRTSSQIAAIFLSLEHSRRAINSKS